MTGEGTQDGKPDPTHDFLARLFFVLERSTPEADPTDEVERRTASARAKGREVWRGTPSLIGAETAARQIAEHWQAVEKAYKEAAAQAAANRKNAETAGEMVGALRRYLMSPITQDPEAGALDPSLDEGVKPAQAVEAERPDEVPGRSEVSYGDDLPGSLSSV